MFFAVKTSPVKIMIISMHHWMIKGRYSLCCHSLKSTQAFQNRGSWIWWDGGSFSNTLKAELWIDLDREKISIYHEWLWYRVTDFLQFLETDDSGEGTHLDFPGGSSREVVPGRGFPGGRQFPGEVFPEVGSSRERFPVGSSREVVPGRGFPAPGLLPACSQELR